MESHDRESHKKRDARNGEIIFLGLIAKYEENKKNYGKTCMESPDGQTVQG